MTARRKSFWQRHSLGLVSIALLGLWIVLYSSANQKTHLGSFFGNAIADWTGVVVTVWGTKFLYERGSAESKQPRGFLPKRWEEFLRDHSFSLVLIVTGGMWVALFARSDPEGKWGEVVGNIVSEWTQLFGLVMLTKRLVEEGSKESRGGR